MNERDVTRPSGQYVPDEGSLDFASHVAASLGMAFDRAATRELGAQLYEAMFADLMRVLNIALDTPDFQSGVFPAARAFAARRRDGQPAVALDMIFDYWVFSLSHLVGILTFCVPEPRELERIVADISHLFDLYGHSGAFDRSRDRIAPYLIDPRYGGDSLKVTAPLARAMIVYVLCHEIAHIQLGHLDRAGSPDLELQADAQAAAHFRQVVRYGQEDRETYIHVDPKMAGAPLVFSMILELFEAWLNARGVDLDSDRQHPPAAQRTAQLQNLMADDLNDVALEIVIAAASAITGLHDLLGLPEPQIWRATNG